MAMHRRSSSVSRVHPATLARSDSDTVRCVGDARSRSIAQR